jgi:sugar lactone lactonase YvrE
VDSEGNAFVADSGNHVIRKISPLGGVTTVAGAAHHAGSADGAKGAARFSSPAAVAVGKDGALFVADAGNHTIRKIARDGRVSTVAGMAGQAGHADGPGDKARFSSPSGIAFAKDGTLVDSDSRNFCIRLVGTDGSVTTWVGDPKRPGASDGEPGRVRFSLPVGLAIDADGNVYVADTNNSVVRRIEPSGVTQTYAGLAPERGSIDAIDNQARFSKPTGVAVTPDGFVYVADTGNSTLRRISPNRLTVTFAGAPEKPELVTGPLPGGFDAPHGIAVAPDGHLVVADTAANAVLVIR